MISYVNSVSAAFGSAGSFFAAVGLYGCFTVGLDGCYFVPVFRHWFFACFKRSEDFNSSNIFRIIVKNTLTSLFVILKFLVSCCVRFVFSNITIFNLHTLIPQYVSKSLSSIDYLKSLITP